MMVMIMIMLMMKMMVHLPKTLPSLITSYSPSAETYKWDPSSPDHHDYHDYDYNHPQNCDDYVMRTILA